MLVEEKKSICLYSNFLSIQLDNYESKSYNR